MPTHFENREVIIRKVREELIGPSPQGTEIDCSQPLSFETREAAYQLFKQSGTGEEILQRDAPLNRYGSGILYPFASQAEETPEAETKNSGVESEPSPTETEYNLEINAVSDEAQKSLADFADHIPMNDEESDFDLTAANKYLPSSVGLSFLAEFPANSKLTITAGGGRYRQVPVKIADQNRFWWKRESVKLTTSINAEQILNAQRGKITVAEIIKENANGLDLSLEIFVREQDKSDQKLLTVCFINRTKSRNRDESSVFQTTLRASIETENDTPQILPYPQAEKTYNDEESKSIALLYRNVQTFAVGHGCAADWHDLSVENARARSVSAECLPVCEVPSITADVRRANGLPLEILMAKLGGIDDAEKILPSGDFSELNLLISEYESWIEDQRLIAAGLPPQHQEAAQRHLADCQNCAERMKDGLRLLENDEQVRTAFNLANQAVLIQQYRSKTNLRRVSYNPKTVRLEFDSPAVEPPINDGKLGKWRAFQIAFLLMSLRSCVELESFDHETVELIWFPTGGGKTEAYLGLTAFCLFMRRLKNRDDIGTHVLMRYTLRLLTAQQFQRASSLICAMEFLRRQHDGLLGFKEFSIALWLGNQVTPGTKQDAVKTLRGLKSGSATAENMFILNRCPWCAAQIGLLDAKSFARNAPRVVGYEESEGSVIFKCADRANCEFADGLPIYVTDEDIYEKRPSLVIGTVDKFAMLAWKPEARAIFGFNEEGERIFSPPGLIIQDELHLISGPLGSIVGLYEAVIEELCTDRRDQQQVRPKIISSTATTRSYAEQIKAVYARSQVQLFPPAGLDVSDSFFACYARDEKGDLVPGRKFIGINAPGLGSLQNAEVRTYTALLQSSFEFTPEERDPWWTLLIFFNNLRMLGNTISLFQASIPAYFTTFKFRNRMEKIRHLNQPLELTGRLRNDEIPLAITKLEVKTTDEKRKPVDVCLASNIIEVGVDIDRLSMMAVIGQPKTTAQYIQVTGRVGRRWWERPGIVATLYSPAKPRDRSHFEHFRSYHEQLYAQVEPTSVTPFSAPALERALHAVLVAFTRQTGTAAQAENPYPFPEKLIENLHENLRRRVALVDPEELPTFEKMFARRVAEWQSWQRTRWGGVMDTNTEDALLRTAGNWVRPEDKLVSWATATSMRNVDAQGEIKITQLYNIEPDANENGELS